MRRLEDLSLIWGYATANNCKQKSLEGIYDESRVFAQGYPACAAIRAATSGRVPVALFLYISGTWFMNSYLTIFPHLRKCFYDPYHFVEIVNLDFLLHDRQQRS